MTKHPIIRLLILLTFLIPLAVYSQATIVYDNLTTSALSGSAYANSENPVFGDSLNLTQGGQLTTLGLSLWNPNAFGNAGTIVAGFTRVNFYDNTLPYLGGVPNGTLLGSADLPWNFATRGGLALGAYSVTLFDMTSFGINLTQNVLITQQFTRTFGTSTANGVILFGSPTIGSSPNTAYFKTTTLAGGLYTLVGSPGQIAFRIETQPVPEPSALVLLGLILPTILSRRR